MPQNNNIIASSGLSRDVSMILDVPPKWMIRNGGFLIIAFIVLVGLLFGAIKMPQTFVSQVKLEQSAAGQIKGTISVANRFSETLKGSKLVKLVDTQNKNICYYARPANLKPGRDSSVFAVTILQADNSQNFALLKNKALLKMNIDLGSASIMAGILKNHSSN